MTSTVWHLCSNRWNSAITEYALRSAQALKMQGWTSELSALPSSPCEKRAKELGVGGPSYRFKFSEVFALRAYAKKLKPSFIITYGGPETFLARFLGVPTVRFRGQDSDLSKPLFPVDLKLNLGFCRGILTPSKIVADRFRAVFPTKKIAAVTLGLDAKVFYPRDRKDAPRPRILFVGRLDPIKGHEKFLGLFSEVVKEWERPGPRPFLEIIGQSANLNATALRARAKALELEEGVDWGLVEARVPNLPERMANATLGVVPSLGSEVICRVTEEFLLSGTPVLLAKVGSLPECLVDENFGALFQDNKHDVTVMMNWIMRAFDENQKVRNVRGEQAAHHFGLERMGEDLEKFLFTL
ncbi:MAG: glycosyltransferase family 1 protein [Proteobacteria bacterium]|nr:MAG: glycosyltransferase family 1 protein [Pseudomonadota bacterium]